MLTYPNFDGDFSQWYVPVWRFCFLCTGSPAAADDLSFRAFLCLGAEKEPLPDGAARLLFSSAATLIEDYYLKKPRHAPKLNRLRELDLPFSITDDLWKFLRLPLGQRMVIQLKLLGLSDDDLSVILRKGKSACQHLSENAEAWRETIEAVQPMPGALDVWSDKIYMRFEERSVAVENSIHGVRYAFHRALPYLALAVLALFALAYWYSGTLR